MVGVIPQGSDRLSDFKSVIHNTGKHPLWTRVFSWRDRSHHGQLWRTPGLSERVRSDGTGFQNRRPKPTGHSGGRPRERVHTKICVRVLTAAPPTRARGPRGRKWTRAVTRRNPTGHADVPHEGSQVQRPHVLRPIYTERQEQTAQRRKADHWSAETGGGEPANGQGVHSGGDRSAVESDTGDSHTTPWAH